MTAQLNRAVTVTIPNPTAAQMIAIAELLEAGAQNETAAEEASKPAKKRGRPAKTVSDDEDEDFGKKELSEEDLDEDEGEESDEESDEDAEDDEEPSVTFAEVRGAINKYGEKHPDQMRAILLGFGLKGPKELSATKNQKHWEPIYRKVMAKLKASKKAK